MNRYHALVGVWILCSLFELMSGHFVGARPGEPAGAQIGSVIGYFVLAPMFVGTVLWAIGLFAYMQSKNGRRSGSPPSPESAVSGSSPRPRTGSAAAHDTNVIETHEQKGRLPRVMESEN